MDGLVAFVICVLKDIWVQSIEGVTSIVAYIVKYTLLLWSLAFITYLEVLVNKPETLRSVSTLDY